MPISPEIPIDQQVKERPETFSENLSVSTGVTPTPANVKPVVNDAGQPLITTPATQSAKIKLPADETTLLAWSKGKVNKAVTWLGKFFLRMLAKENAAKIGSQQKGEEDYASNDD